ncbi:unnamed protein product [Ilex paraguariensis]|uniref:Uncharacterized protein n=1 Tax=Ilex paraguariensis TaxID=185542 RepID=A0ABC8S3Y4_9AQUA
MMSSQGEEVLDGSISVDGETQANSVETRGVASWPEGEATKAQGAEVEATQALGLVSKVTQALGIKVEATQALDEELLGKTPLGKASSANRYEGVLFGDEHRHGSPRMALTGAGRG